MLIHKTSNKKYTLSFLFLIIDDILSQISDLLFFCYNTLSLVAACFCCIMYVVKSNILPTIPANPNVVTIDIKAGLGEIQPIAVIAPSPEEYTTASFIVVWNLVGGGGGATLVGAAAAGAASSLGGGAGGRICP